MILVIDNYDSFTYNLVQYLGEWGADIVVRRNDEIELGEIEDLNPAGIILSPGPCTPTESGVCLDILASAMIPGSTLNKRETTIFGVCLGHQAIGQVAGGVVSSSSRIMHGKTSMVKHDGKGVFRDLPDPIRVTRYHSLAVLEQGFPDCLEISARAEDDGEIMALRHKELPIEGVQFHPESVLTDEGKKMMLNVLNQAEGGVAAGSSSG
jgi:anthranilate synthase/aminodeoxychorismate synthase-like glutamine amidotransferase